MKQKELFSTIRKLMPKLHSTSNRKIYIIPKNSKPFDLESAFIPPNTPVALLVESMGHSELTVRAEAARRLGELRETIHLGLLLDALEDEQRFVRAEAARALGKQGKQVPIAPLVKALGDRDGSVRVAAAQALGMLGHQESQADLMQALHDSWAPVREAAVLALGKLRKPVSISIFLPILQDEDKFVRIAVLSVMETLGECVPMEPLVAALSDAQERVREAAIQALVAQGERLTIDKLAPALNNKSDPACEAAQRILSMLDKQFHLELLETASDSEKPPVRPVAVPALQRRSLVLVPNPTTEVVPATASLNSKQHSTELEIGPVTDNPDESQTKGTSRFIASVSAPLAPFAQAYLPEWNKPIGIGCVAAQVAVFTVVIISNRKKVVAFVTSSASRILHFIHSPTVNLLTDTLEQKGE